VIDDGPLTADELATLEASFQQALRTGDASGLTVLGYGEISTVVALSTRSGRWACKRLPPFDGPGRVDAYREQFGLYLGRLAEAGVQVVESRLQTTPAEGGRTAVFCIQPILDADHLGDRALARMEEPEAVRWFERILQRTLAVVDERTGFDAQISNWWFDGDEPVYLDVTTPLMRDEAGRDLLDVGLFLAQLPWLLRGVVRVFLVRGILDTYQNPRGVVVDLLANLVKEGLGHLVPPFLEVANPHLDRAVMAEEVHRYYRGDARTWELLQRLRRLDRWWQRTVRRRTYPFLLPGPIERRV